MRFTEKEKILRRGLELLDLQEAEIERTPNGDAIAILDDEHRGPWMVELTLPGGKAFWVVQAELCDAMGTVIEIRQVYGPEDLQVRTYLLV